MGDLLSALIGAIIGGACSIVAVFITNKHNTEQSRKLKELEFIQRQVDEFYSPIAALREEIVSLGSTAVKIGDASDAQNYEEQTISEQRRKQNDHNVEYYHRAFRRLAENYFQILSFFRSKKWLAEPSTVAHYDDLLRFAELVQLDNEEKIDSEVLKRLGHDPKNVAPFFDEVKEQLKAKQIILKQHSMAASAPAVTDKNEAAAAIEQTSD